jgi:hypothetical protein
MKYNREVDRRDTISRFGTLETSTASYRLPTCAPTPKNRTEVKAIEQLHNMGARYEIIVPPLSRVSEVADELSALAGNLVDRLSIGYKKPLILPDIENEIFSFNCEARKKLFKWNGRTSSYETEEAISGIVNSNLSGDNSTHLEWRKMILKYGYAPLLNFMSRKLAGLGADVFFVPTPIVRAENETVRLALDIANAEVPLAKLNQKFTMHGVQFLLYGEIFEEGSQSLESRTKLIEGLRGWAKKDSMNSLFLSFKVHDPNGKILRNPNTGHSARRNLSEFITNLQEAVEASGSVLLGLNWGNWSLGILDSGADIVSFKVDGRADITRVFSRRKGFRSNRRVPDFMMPRALTDAHYERLKTIYEETDAFPCSYPVRPEPYWEFSYDSQHQFVAIERLATQFNLSDEYRNAGIDISVNFREAVTSRVNDSEISQELHDLSPSTW